jgi:acetate kinase
MRSGRLIPVLNSSSSSLKSAPFETGATSEATTRGEIENLGSTAHLKVRVSKGADLRTKCWPPSAPQDFAEVPAVSVAFIDEHWGTDSLIAIDHPVVQRRARHIGHERLIAESLASLEALTRLQPRHLPSSLTPMRAVLAAWPTLPRVDVRSVGAHAEATIARHAKAHLRGHCDECEFASA